MSITIAGQPVLIDYDGMLQAWVDAYLRTCDQDQFFVQSPWFNAGRDFLNDDSLFESTLPKLPPIKLGCIQWPAVGCHRFARGLFAVDRVAFRAITEAAWGVPWNTDGTMPSNWDQSARSPVLVTIIPAVFPNPEFSLKMHVLPPIKVTDDIYIIRLVDMRYYLREFVGSFSPALTWASLVSQSSARYSVAIGTAPADALRPDGAFFRTRSVPESLLLDSAVYSLGWRPVVPCRQTSDSVVEVVAQGPTAASVTRAALLTGTDLTGGWSEVRTIAKSLVMNFHQAWSHYGLRSKSLLRSTVAVNRQGIGLETQCTLLNQVQVDASGIHTLEPNAAALGAYIDYIYGLHTQANGWNQHEYCVAFTGLVEIVPSGHDDYIEWDCSPNGPVTRVKSLPNTFIPRCFFPQHAIPSTPASESAWWYCTHDQTMCAIALDDANSGVWDEDNEAWEKRFVNVQLVDSDLLLPSATPSAKLAFASVKALVARKTAVKAGESLVVHFANQIMFRTAPEAAPGDPPIFEVFRGWVIAESASNTREVIFSCEIVTTEESSSSPFSGVKYASGNVLWATEPDLIGTVIDAYDHWCILDLEYAELEGIRMIASWGVTESSATGAAPGTLTPYHWSLTDRCCD